MVLFFLACAGEPVGALPSRQFAKDGAVFGQLRVEGRAPDSACCGLLAIREVIGIQQAKGFGRAFHQIALVALKRLHPRNVDIAQIEGLCAVFHPLRQRHARAARRLDADRIEPCGNPDIVHLGRKAKVIGIIGRKAFGTVEKSMDPCLGQHRHPVDGHFKDRFEVIEIFGQLVEFEILRDRPPGFRHWFEGPQHHFARVFLVIRAFIRHPQHGHLGQPGDGFGHDVEMFASLKRHVGARHAANLVPPHASAVHDHIAGDMSLILAIVAGPINPGHTTTVPGQASDRDPLFDDRATLTRALGECQSDVGRITLPVFWKVNPPGHAIDVEMVIAGLDLIRRDLFHFDPKGTRHSSRTVQFLKPFTGQGSRDRAHPFKARGDTGFSLKAAIEFLTVLGELGHVRRRAQLGDQTCCMPGGARGQLFALKQDHICPAEFRQVIGHGAANNAAADDHHACCLGKVGHDESCCMKVWVSGR